MCVFDQFTNSKKKIMKVVIMGFQAIMRKKAVSLMPSTCGSADGILAIVANRLNCPYLVNIRFIVLCFTNLSVGDIFLIY